MNSLKLKESVRQIYLTEAQQEELIQNVRKQAKQRQKRKKQWKKTGTAAAVFAVILGVSVPIQAGIRYLVSDRLESVPKPELEKQRKILQAQENTEADSFSRAYTQEEQNRLRKLEKAYQNGRFPNQQLMQADSLGQIPQNSVAYATDTGTFYLPDRTLTDEELLQIIDFHHIQNYALSQGTTAQKELKNHLQKEQRLKKALNNAGGMTKQEAKKAADQYLKTEFGLSAQNMDSDMFLDEQQDHVLIYHISYETQDNFCFYAYGIDIDAQNGKLVNTSHASLPKERTAQNILPDQNTVP